METRKEIEIFEGDRAIRYDNFISNFFPDYNLIMEIVPKILSGQFSDKELLNILVVVCGTGNETKRLLDFNKNWRIDACDPSKEMIYIAKQKLASYSNLNLINSTIEQVDTTYDAATLFLVLHFLTGDGAKQELLINICKRLKSGGKLIMLDICGTQKELKKNFKILSSLFQEAWSEEEIKIRRERILNTLNVISEKRCITLLKKPGFKTPIKFHQSTITRAWVVTKK